MFGEKIGLSGRRAIVKIGEGIGGRGMAVGAGVQKQAPTRRAGDRHPLETGRSVIGLGDRFPEMAHGDFQREAGFRPVLGVEKQRHVSHHAIGVAADIHRPDAGGMADGEGECRGRADGQRSGQQLADNHAALHPALAHGQQEFAVIVQHQSGGRGCEDHVETDDAGPGLRQCVQHRP